MRLLLIGGNGFIGSPLADELCAAGHRVCIFHRGHHALRGSHPVEEILGDRNRLASSRDRLEEFRPDVIVDLILSSGEQARELVEVAGALAARVTALSSMDVYRAWGVLQGVENGPLASLPLTEDSPLRTTRALYSPESIEAMRGTFNWLDQKYDKISVEEAILGDAAVSGTILRLPMMYGVQDPLTRFLPITKRIADGRSRILLSAEYAAWRGPRGYCDNVAHAIALAALSDRAAGRIYNVCDEPCLSELEWRTRIAKQANWGGKFVVLESAEMPKHLVVPGNLKQHVVASSQRIRNELGYVEPVGSDEAIRRTIAWQQTSLSKIDPRQFDYAAEDAALSRTPDRG
ncbi:MAG: NAD-dependent epimerase/dehydratase family protein [Acidobacteria bacterium]|nr:NAD-dependent epimerase/dehydratase family protein [Acidobacteriota bacterium]